jgi:hypothetical protein
VSGNIDTPTAIAAIVSPIKALGMLMPAGGAAEISFAPIVFAPGDAAAPADAGAHLAPLASLLAQRPALGLALVGHAGEGDKLALAERILIERVSADQGLPALADAGFFAKRRVQGALADRGRGEAGALEPEDQALLGRYLEATPVPPARYEDLARRLAEAVRDVLATEHALAPARLIVEADAGPGASDVVPELRTGAASE